MAKLSEDDDLGIISSAEHHRQLLSASLAVSRLQKEENPFRVYFKGMSSNSMVNGSMVQLSGIGVAICDPKDKLILKIQKPGLDAGTRLVLEAKALIEGLSAAYSIGIKKVIVFFDYPTLYNHVAGIWTSKQKKVTDLINQVWLHLENFEACKFSLLLRCHVSFAVRLAHDAIDSQISHRGESSTSHTKGNMETCLICLELTECDKMFTIEPCLHNFCFSCIKQHAEVKLLDGMLPFCPHDNCKVKLTIDDSKKFLTPKLLDIMAQRIKEESIPPSQKLYCPNPSCSMLMSLTEAIEPINLSRASTSRGTYDNLGLRKCVKCEGLFCINCKVKWHEGMSCGEYKRRNPNPKPEDIKLQSLARQRLWHQCVKCSHMIELAEGCFHMTCWCGYEFCYTCGKEWKDKKATCSCPLWDERYIRHDDAEEEDHADSGSDEDEDEVDDDNFPFGFNGGHDLPYNVDLDDFPYGFNGGHDIPYDVDLDKFPFASIGGQRFLFTGDLNEFPFDRDFFYYDPNFEFDPDDFLL